MKRSKRKSRRERLEDAIEKAIALLDAVDGDPELEPSLGWTEYGGGMRCNTDLEVEHRVKPPEGYMHPEDLAPGNTLAHAVRNGRLCKR